MSTSKSSGATLLPTLAPTVLGAVGGVQYRSGLDSYGARVVLGVTYARP